MVYSLTLLQQVELVFFYFMNVFLNKLVLRTNKESISQNFNSCRSKEYPKGKNTQCVLVHV